MKTKLAVAFSVGVAFTISVIVILGLVTPSAKAEDTSLSSDNSSSETSMADLWAVLQQVGQGIQDTDTRNFYNKLIAAYDLPAPSDNTTVLPDIQTIQQAAVTLPLQEAGNQIQDPDIAVFYQKFLADSGLSANATASGGQ